METEPTDKTEENQAQNPVPWKDMGIPFRTVYLAARFPRKDEIRGYAEILRRRGYGVTARWFNGTHDAGATDSGQGMSHDDGFNRMCAAHDLHDIDQADVLLSFTEEPNSPFARGGRHVEFGYALSGWKDLINVGPKENVFHFDTDRIKTYATFEEMLAAEFPTRSGVE